MMTISKSIIATFVCFFFSLIWSSSPLFGWSYYSLEGVGTSCSIELNEKSLSVISYNMTILITVFFIPLIVIVGSHLLIIQKVNYYFFRLLA